MRQFLWFIFGFLVAVMLARATATVTAEQVILLSGNNSGTTKVVAVDTNGFVQVQGN